MKKILFLLWILLFPIVGIGQVINVDLPSKLPGLELNGTLVFTGTMDYGIDMSLATITTADIRLQNGATINNTSADLLTITEATVDISGAFTASSVASDAAISGTDITGSGTVQGADLIATNMATGATVTLASYTATGQLDSTETVLHADITIDTINVDFIDVTNDIDVGDTIEFDNGLKIYNDHADTATIEEASVKFVGGIDGFQTNGTTSLYWHEHNAPAFSTSTGASGAVLVAPTANTLGGYQLNVVTEQLYHTMHIEDDWDGQTDIPVEVHWEVNEAASADGTVDLKLTCYYKGNHEAANKTQTLEEPVTITGNKAQFTQHITTFTLNWDEASNVIEVGDVLSFILNLETDTSECDDIIVNHIVTKYMTTKPAITTE